MPPLKSRYEDMPSEEVYRRGQELGLYDSTFLRSPPPSYDPIIGSIFTTIFAGAAIGGVPVATIATAIATTAVTAGFQFGDHP